MANPFDSNDEWATMISSMPVKSSPGLSPFARKEKYFMFKIIDKFIGIIVPGKNRSFFIRFALHIPPKYANSDSMRVKHEFGNLVCKMFKKKN